MINPDIIQMSQITVSPFFVLFAAILVHPTIPHNRWHEYLSFQKWTQEGETIYDAVQLCEGQGYLQYFKSLTTLNNSHLLIHNSESAII